MIRRIIVSAGMFLLCTCGGDPAFVPDTGGFDVDSDDQAEIDTAAEQGEGADGSYDWDDDSDTLTLIIEASTFECGIVVGTIVATVTELTATRMVWSAAEPGWLLPDLADRSRHHHRRRPVRLGRHRPGRDPGGPDRRLPG